MRKTTSLLVVLPLLLPGLLGCASTPTPEPSAANDPMVAPPAPAESAAVPADPSTAGAPARDVAVGSSSESMRAGSRPAASRPTAAAVPASAPAGGANSCKLAGEGDSPVDKACNEGGLAAAKQTMKGLLKAGRAAGVRHECDDCHINAEDYSQLSKGADERFAKLLAATRK